jgi:hypothetical protein
MKCIEVVQYKNRLDSLFTEVSSFSTSIELQSHWARYLCVLVSGFIEVSVRAVYTQYAKSASSENVTHFVAGQLNDFRNPKMERILQLTRSFNAKWADDLELATEGELKDAVDSVVANRNQITHGQQVGLSYARLKEYYQRIIRVVELIEKQCNL